MKRLTLFLLILTIAATGCQALILDAEAGLVDANTAQIEIQSEADLVAALRESGDKYEVVIDSLLADRATDRISQAALMDRLLDLLEDQAKPQVPTGAILSLVIVVSIAGVAMWNAGRQREIDRAMMAALLAAAGQAVPRLGQPRSYLERPTPFMVDVVAREDVER